jgi:hypothetical protein
MSFATWDHTNGMMFMSIPHFLESHETGTMIEPTISRMGLWQDIAALILELMWLIVMIRFQFAPMTGVYLMNLWMSRRRRYGSQAIKFTDFIVDDVASKTTCPKLVPWPFRHKQRMRKGEICFVEYPLELCIQPEIVRKVADSAHNIVTIY